MLLFCQFEGFVQHNGYAAHKLAYPEDWNINVVFLVLQKLIAKSNITQQLEVGFGSV